MQEAQSTLPLGSIIQDQYVVESVLGKDNSGTVYLVRERQKQQSLFVLKEVIYPEKEEQYQLNFESIEKLDHPALPCVYHVLNDDKQDRVYILVSYIEGSNLEVLRRMQPELRFSLSQAMAFIAPIMDAVIYLHSQHPPIIHQNIKPSNIIEPHAGPSTVLVGFALEKEHDPEKTFTIALHKAASYRATEQYSGAITSRTDIYALGATLYTLLTGTIPANVLYRLKKLSDKEADPLVPVNQLTLAVPTPIAEAIHRAMSINSDARFSTVEQFCEALRQASNTTTSGQQLTEHIGTVPTEENTELDSYLPVQRAVEPVVGVKEASPLTADPVAQQTADPQVVAGKVLESNADIMVQHTREPIVEIEEVPASKRDSMVLGVSELASASSVIPDRPAPSKEVKAPAITVSLQEQTQAYSFKKHGIVFLTFFAVIVTLFISLGVGASLWSYTAEQYHPISVIPTSTSPSRQASSPPTVIPTSRITSTPIPPPTASPNSTVTPTPAPVPSSYPNIAASYTGTLHDIPTGITTNVSLTRIKQQQGNISGYFGGMSENGPFNGIPQNGPFTGSITTAKQVQFMVTSDTGQATFSFDGGVQPDGTMAGSYCNLGEATGQCSEYGIWSVSSAT